MTVRTNHLQFRFQWDNRFPGVVSLSLLMAVEMPFTADAIEWLQTIDKRM
jgi:hypothetical protein